MATRDKQHALLKSESSSKLEFGAVRTGILEEGNDRMVQHRIDAVKRAISCLRKMREAPLRNRA